MTEFLAEELDRFCYWQRERENIRLQKEVLELPAPWTDDVILQDFKFCQVYREDDRTTRWFKKHIREPLADDRDVLMATVIFRWFNHIDTGRTLIEHDLLKNWDRKKAIDEITKQPKWITGAYIIKTPFMAYEVVTDLRHTYLLRDANDIMTWANAGPGAMRGLNRLTGRELGYSKRSHDWVGEMNDLYKVVEARLPFSITMRNDMSYEMREIEGGLCEFDKYSRIVKGEGRTRSVYKHNNLPMIEDLIEGESKYGKSE